MSESFWFKTMFDVSPYIGRIYPQRLVAKAFYRVGLQCAEHMLAHKWVAERNDQYDAGYRQALKDVLEEVQKEIKANEG